MEWGNSLSSPRRVGGMTQGAGFWRGGDASNEREVNMKKNPQFEQLENRELLKVPWRFPFLPPWWPDPYPWEPIF
ncbi:MAG: hypothetical protein QF819_10390 [Gemmatimonadota bacterium]|jgi:hypothetical protein|nr:hypothetical protein [Gemmatimonadota bacterium]